MNKALEIKNLRLSFYGEKGCVQAVKGVNLHVNQGETLALVGESGCGKTALCRCILGLHSSHAKIEGGSISLGTRDITGLSEKDMGRIRGKEVAMVFQDPMSSLNPVFTIGSQIAQAILAHALVGRRQGMARGVELLRRVEIPEAEQRARQYPHQLSGGMRQRAAIAIALACNPGLIIADEPTTALDIATQDKIMTLLKRLCAEDGKSLLFVTHDLSLAENLADRVAVMKDGVIVEVGRTEDIFQNPHHEYTKKLLSFAAYGKGTSHFHGSPEKNHRTPQCDGEPMVKVQGLYKSFEIGKHKSEPALSNINLNIYKGEIVGIVGDSGCGKSTLARCMMDIYVPEEGSVAYAENCKRQMIFQDSSSAFNERMTLGQIIAEPLLLQHGKKTGVLGFFSKRAEIKAKVEEMAEAVGLDKKLLQRHPYDVSGGQRQRAAIARALITNPDFVIADEPISSLDIPVQSQIIHLLKELHDQRQLTMMIISHDLPMVKHISDRIVEF